MSDADTFALDTDEKRVSYGFGMQFGQQLVQNTFEGMSLEAAIAGMSAMFKQTPVPITDTQMQAAYDAVQAKREAKQAEDAAKMGGLSVEFMRANGASEGVISLDSGVQYQILEEGDGAKPAATDTVRVHYEGSLIDGQIFDSSIARGEPAEFGVTQVIPGWVEALQLMSVGSKWRVAIPSDKAYGPAGSPPSIPGHSALVFEIHLIAIV